jgi:hypothetical protein
MYFFIFLLAYELSKKNHVFVILMQDFYFFWLQSSRRRPWDHFSPHPPSHTLLKSVAIRPRMTHWMTNET